MTESEIIRSFREAKDKKKQLTIISQLSSRSVTEIVSILKEHGYDVQTGKRICQEPEIPTEKPVVKTPSSIQKNKINFTNGRRVLIKTPLKKNVYVKKRIPDKAIINKKNTKENKIVETNTQTVKENPAGRGMVNKLISNEELKRRYVENGETIASIASSLGINMRTLQNHMYRYGIKRKACSNKSPISNMITDDELRARFVDNKESIPSIAESLGINAHTLQKYIWNHGIKRYSIDKDTNKKCSSKPVTEPQKECIENESVPVKNIGIAEEISRLVALEKEYESKLTEIRNAINHLTEAEKSLRALSEM